MELNDLLGAGPKLRAAGGKLCSQLSTQETLRPSSLLAEPEEATLTRAADVGLCERRVRLLARPRAAETRIAELRLGVTEKCHQDVSRNKIND